MQLEIFFRSHIDHQTYGKTLTRVEKGYTTKIIPFFFDQYKRFEYESYLPNLNVQHVNLIQVSCLFVCYQICFNYLFYTPPPQTKFRGYIGITLTDPPQSKFRGYIGITLSVCLSVRPSVCLSVCLSVYLSVCLSVCSHRVRAITSYSLV